MKHRSFNLLGNVALVNFSREDKKKAKVSFAKKLIEENKSVRTVFEKEGKFYGRLRKIKVNLLAGEDTKEVLYKENNCLFRFNIEKTYFSSRLSNERKEIASEIKKGETVLVMFAGVAPYSIVIAKNSPAKKVYSNEINREANKYAEINIKRNKLSEKIELVSGDIKKVALKLKMKFDVIVMPRPKLKDSFLEQAFFLSKKNTRIYYYDFCKEKTEEIVEKVKREAERNGKKIKILKVKSAGEIAPRKIRIRVDFKVLKD